jgi:ABC-type Mn2+/Zn2+ transport system ATPase subunit
MCCAEALHYAYLISLLHILALTGGGKSTLVKLLAGVLEPTSGDVVRDQRLRIGAISSALLTVFFCVVCSAVRLALLSVLALKRYCQCSWSARRSLQSAVLHDAMFRCLQRADITPAALLLLPVVSLTTITALLP